MIDQITKMAQHSGYSFLPFTCIVLLCFHCGIIITGRNEAVAKVMFLHVCVILFTGGVSGQGEPPREGEPPGADTPLEQKPPRSRHTPSQDWTRPPRDQTTTPLGRENPLGPDHPLPLGRENPFPRDQTTPRAGRPPREADASTRSMSGRYASYWNAFLLLLCEMQISSLKLQKLTTMLLGDEFNLSWLVHFTVIPVFPLNIFQLKASQ